MKEVCKTLSTSMKDIFFLFTTSVLDHIVYHSNKYASECLGEKFSTRQQIMVDELLTYMGFMILMGIIQLLAMQDYWKTTSIFHYIPVTGRISRTRFFELHRYLHFADNSTLSPPGSPGYDRLGKIAPIAMLSNQFAAVYNPGKEISMDEAMMPFKGRSSLKQYLPLKPIKRHKVMDAVRCCERVRIGISSLFRQEEQRHRESIRK